jgi:2-methylisocitrate lyase-like PEP mutase family enzyme
LRGRPHKVDPAIVSWLASFGLPDLGLTSLTEVAEDARRITAATTLPLLVDIDTGQPELEVASCRFMVP